MLSINKLYKKFHQKIILEDISVTVLQGEIALLLGESGVGKSTLLRILCGLEHADGGTITLDGLQVDLDSLHFHHKVGMVFQQFNLFEHLSVLTNITIALEKVKGKSKSQAHDTAIALLSQFGLLEQQHKVPAQLSGGQKQRVALVRALALKPDIMCFDEPTSALDPQLFKHVVQAIEKLALQQYIIFIASHDPRLIESLDCTIYLMEKGQIIESARSKEFKKYGNHFPLIKRFIEGHNQSSDILF